MKVNKKVKWVIGSGLGTFSLFFIILIIHIATAEPVVYDNANLQISRIDFNEPINPMMAKEIHRKLKSIPGVKNNHLNAGTGVLVYFHDNRIVDAQKVYTQLMAMGDYKAKPYVISAEMASKKVCPVMNPDSFSYKFSKVIQRIF